MTKAPKESFKPCLWMIVTATSVEADPMGVMFPPRLAPKITAHQSGSVGGRTMPFARGMPAMIFASIAARGMLSVTELNAAVEPKAAPVPTAPDVAHLAVMSAMRELELEHLSRWGVLASVFGHRVVTLGLSPIPSLSVTYGPISAPSDWR